MKIKYLLAICTLLTSLAASAASTTPKPINGVTYEIIWDTENVEITEINKSTISEDLIIPSKVTIGDNEYSVTKIRDEVFKECTKIKSVQLPETLESIGIYAFKGCSSLQKIIIPESVTSIGNYAFQNCTSLQEITIPTSVTIIGDGTFNNCSVLASVDINEGVTSILYMAFSSCSSLTSITIPRSVSLIDQHTFDFCSNLVSVTIDNPDPSTITLGKESLPIGNQNFKVFVPRGSVNDWIGKKIGTTSSTKEKLTADMVFPMPYYFNHDMSYTSQIEESHADVNYDVDFVSDGWQALFVPFTSEYSLWKDYFIVGTLSSNNVQDEQDVLVWSELSNVEDDDHQHKVLAGHPYIIKKREGVEIPNALSFSDVEIEPASYKDPVTIEGVNGTYTLNGTYENFIVPADNSKYYALASSGFVAGAPGVTLSQNRIYLQYTPNAQTSQLAQVPFMMSMPKISDIPTEVSNIVIEENDDAIYDLYGRRVNNPAHGIYIKNGKKFIVK